MKPKQNKQQIRMLVYGDSPAVATGFANVTRNIFTRLAKRQRFLIDFLGINDTGGWKDPSTFGQNMHIYPAINLLSPTSDLFGRPRLVNSLLMKDTDLTPPWDIIFTLQDPFILEEKFVQWGTGTMEMLRAVSDGFREQFPPDWWSKIVSYWPIDSELKENWYKEAIAKPHFSIAYTEYGRKQIEDIQMKANKTLLDHPLEVIYHGVDTKIFRPMAKTSVMDFRKNFFQGRVKPETFLCIVVARNQPRKDLPRTMKAFKEFQRRRPDSFLYIHAKNQDAGGTLTEFGNTLGLKVEKDYGFPSKFSENRGYPEETLNMLYNTADCLLSTTLGEGFGLPFFEAMATNTLVIAPDNTTVPELLNVEVGTDVKKLDDDSYINKIRGIGVKSGSTSSEFYCLGGVDKERYRPLTNIDDMVQKMIWAYDNPDKVNKITERALNWVQQYDWEKITDKWSNLFERVYKELNEERQAWIPPENYVKDELPEKVQIKLGEDKKDANN